MLSAVVFFPMTWSNCVPMSAFQSTLGSDFWIKSQVLWEILDSYKSKWGPIDGMLVYGFAGYYCKALVSVPLRWVTVNVKFEELFERLVWSLNRTNGLRVLKGSMARLIFEAFMIYSLNCDLKAEHFSVSICMGNVCVIVFTTKKDSRSFQLNIKQRQNPTIAVQTYVKLFMLDNSSTILSIMMLSGSWQESYKRCNHGFASLFAANLGSSSSFRVVYKAFYLLSKVAWVVMLAEDMQHFGGIRLSMNCVSTHYPDNSLQSCIWFYKLFV